MWLGNDSKDALTFRWKGTLVVACGPSVARKARRWFASLGINSVHRLATCVLGLCRLWFGHYSIDCFEDEIPKSITSSSCVSIWKNFAATIGDVFFDMRSKYLP
jgi:hypothetical protein